VDASSFGQNNVQRPQRRDRRSIEALRQEARRRLAQARRADKSKRGNKAGVPSKRGQLTNVKRSHTATVHIDLIVDNLPEETEPPPNEETPGAFIGVNGDDDNDNLIPDKDATENPVLNENNLIPVIILYEVSEPLEGHDEPVARTLTLDGRRKDKFRIWTTPTKGVEVTLPHTFTTESFPLILYVEGIKTSNFQEAELTLTYEAATQSGTTTRVDKVFMTLFQAKLGSSAGHHVVYRRPAQPLGPPNDELVIAQDDPEALDPGLPNIGPADEVDENDREHEVPNTGGSEPSSPPVIIDPGSNNPQIGFSVSLVQCSQWLATVAVYRVGETVPTGSYTTPIHSAGAMGESIMWDQIFPMVKPPSGVYTYNVLVYGFVDDNESGDMRLNGKYTVQNMQVNIQQDNPVTGELTLGITFDIVNTRGDILNVPDVKVRVVNPRLAEQPQPIPVNSNQQGGVMHCTGTWKLTADTPEELGTWLFVADVEITEEGEQRTVPEGSSNRATDYAVSGIALGFRLWAGQQQTSPVSPTHEPYADYRLLLRAFVRLSRHGQAPRWYSSESVPAEQLNQYAWIGQWAPQGSPQEADRLPDDARSTEGLDLSVKWRIFGNVVAKATTIPHSTKRWYGMVGNPTTVGGGLTHSTFVDVGTIWWGARVTWERQQNGTDGNAVRHTMVFLYPTDRSGNTKVIRLGNGDTEFHGRVEKTGDARFNWANIGIGDNTTRQKLWTPNPWNGRISGQLIIDDNPEVPDDNGDFFAPDDPFFNSIPEAERQEKRKRQGDFNQTVLGWAFSFYYVPYSWCGSSYGGSQSKGTDEFTCSDRSAHPPDGVYDGKGFGTDCGGHVSRAAIKAGVNIGGRLGTATLRGINKARDVTWHTLRQGDFATWPRHHVVYATGNAQIDPSTDRVTSLPTVEASGSDQMVLERSRSGSELQKSDGTNLYIPRRWIAP
jgi:hypothetical protein